MEKEGNNLFQVNLKGMIALLSEHIYSNPNTFVRELLQNSVDAITALHNIDENYSGVSFFQSFSCSFFPFLLLFPFVSVWLLLRYGESECASHLFAGEINQ